MMPHAKASRRPQLSTIPSWGYEALPSAVDGNDRRGLASEMSMHAQALKRSCEIRDRAPMTSSIGGAATLNFQRGSCDACDRLDNGVKKIRMIPCSVSLLLLIS
jgi:hypothetical protein